MAGWINPDIYYDGASQWTDEENMGDGNTGTYATSQQPGAGMWEDWVRAYVSDDVTNCTKIRFWTSEEAGANVGKIDIDVYYEGGSHGVYYASPHHGGWWEANLVASKTVSGMMLRYQGGATAGKEVYVHGLQFWGDGGPTGGAPETSPEPADDGFSYPIANFDNSSQWIDAGEHDGSCDSFLRFPNVIIPNGSTINSAKLRLYIYEVDNPTLLKVFAEDAADPAVPTTKADHSARVRTTAGVDWDLTVDPDTWQLSPECAAVIQELVDSYDYTLGKAITILLDDDGSANDQLIRFRSINTIPQGLYAPQLILDFTPPVTWDLTIASGAGGSVITPGEGVFADYADGATVPIVADPDPGKVFVNWTGDTGDIANPNAASTTIEMNADYSITANFNDAPAGGAVPERGAGRMTFRTTTEMI